MIDDQAALPVVLALAALFLGWYILGNELMRRRARRLALWCKRAVDPLGGQQAVRWLTLQSFRLELDALNQPFERGTITGLVESWDVPLIWIWNRRRGRRDMVLLQIVLRRQPLWGFELYRPGSLLAGDARHVAADEGWSESALDEFRLCLPGPGAAALPNALLAELDTYRSNLVRLAVRRRDIHLTLALNVPDPAGFGPDRFADLVGRLARAIVA
ncbi:MAG: hypothetical protein EPO26_18640 [Chloroflexota bacterium]|nr:MAG: hypothetical protein EPO26_18640 [Chloroflexota bacterium]